MLAEPEPKPETPRTSKMPRGAKTAKYMEWVLTPETKLRKALSGMATRIKGALPDENSIADRIFDALDGQAVVETPSRNQTVEIPEPDDPYQNLVTVNTVEMLPSTSQVDLFSPINETEALTLQELSSLYSELQRRFLEHHSSTERRCHDIYEAAMHQRSISETRAQEAADRVQSMRIVLEKREAQIVHLQAELQSTAAQKQMVKVQLNGVIASLELENKALQKDIAQLLEEEGSVAPTADLTLRESEAQRYASKIQKLESTLREHEQLLQEQAEQLKLKDNERYELLVTNEQLSQEALDASDATKRAKADKTRMVSELETMKENIQDQMDRVRVEERRLVQEALEAELRESVKISIREAVASAQESLLCEIEQLTLENLAAEQRLAEQENAHLEEVGQLQATIGELQHRNQELERKRTKDAQRHKKAAAAGAQAAAAALASELKVFMKRESPDKSHESSPAQVARANK